MKKSFVKTVCGIVLAGMMLASTGCGMSGTSAKDSTRENSANVVEASDGELFSDTTLDAKQVMVCGKIYEIPTASKMSLTQIPNNLGVVVKADRIIELEPLFGKSK